jgi:uncharacterized protein
MQIRHASWTRSSALMLLFYLMILRDMVNMSALAWSPHLSRSLSRFPLRQSRANAAKMSMESRYRHRKVLCLSASALVPSGAGREHTVRQRTQQWLESVVIGMNLCPFAERPHREQLVTIQTCWGHDEVEIAHSVLQECKRRRDVPGTTLIVCPECHPQDFGSFLDVVEAVEEEMRSRNLAKYIQVAPFHPQFVFDGTLGESPDNWTNRSPYPTFHILREEEVTVAVDKLDGDAGRVWKRNVNLLNDLHHNLGRNDFERFMSIKTMAADNPDSSPDNPDYNLVDRVKEIVRRFRSQL